MPAAQLLEKYNVAVPRYTSYPTVPVWQDYLDVDSWKNNIQIAVAEDKEICVYIHLPFCESLCTYCGCTKKITTNHAVEPEYIKAVLKEWQMYVDLMPVKPVIKELHLGGGTPTFFSPEHLKLLLEKLFSMAEVAEDHEFSIEGHPNNTTTKHLQVLYDLGFRRVSFGVQENDPEIQKVINRIQPFENVARATNEARRIGFTSVNFDLIYGLPFQTKKTIQATLKQCLTLKPDRIAFYSYAHVPWKSRVQRLFDEHDLPSAEEKMELYVSGKKIFVENGYTEIGMDHFSLPDDDLTIAMNEGRLFRNFMGYTINDTKVSIGLGMSAISDTGNAFAQNEKALSDYYKALAVNRLPVTKGIFLTETDVHFRQYILDVSCNNNTIFREDDRSILEQCCFDQFKSLQKDGLITFDKKGLQVTPIGKHFIRNICSAFDLHLAGANVVNSKPVFSKAI